MGFPDLHDPQPMGSLQNRQVDFMTRQKGTTMVAHQDEPLSLLQAVRVLGGEMAMAIHQVVASEVRASQAMEADSGSRGMIKDTPTLITSQDLSVGAG